MKNILQEEFDKWSEPITGNSCDYSMSSHGRAFEAGYLAALKNAANACKELLQHYGHTIAVEQCVSLINQLHDAESLKSDPSGFRPRGVE